jgi:hypothetical protein
MSRTLTLLSCLFPALVLAQTLGTPLVGTASVVNNGPGDQTDPHISGAVVAYTNETDGSSEIRFHDLETGMDQAIPSSGAFDFVSDVSGSTVVFTRVTSSSAIFAYDVGTQAPPVEVAPLEGASRRAAVIGHRTVAWQDYTYRGPTLAPELAAFNLDTGVLTRLTDDDMIDRTPAVSEDGKVIVWAKCQKTGTLCDVWQATATQDGLVSKQLTGAEGEDAQPDTNGQVVVYSSARAQGSVTERDIYWQPVGGGPEQRLVLPGADSNPSISGSLLVFEHFDASAASPNLDIYLYSLETQTLYALTQTPTNEVLSDISVAADGTARVVWTVPENGDFNVHAFTFKLPKQEPPTCTVPEEESPAEDVCNAPGERPLLASVQVARDTGKPTEVSLAFQGEGAGVLCVDNGFEGSRATAGWVGLNGALEVDPSRFQQDVALLAQRVTLQPDNTLEARVAGKPGSAFRVRLYGPLPVHCEPPTVDPEARVLPGRVIAPVTVEVSGSGEPLPPPSEEPVPAPTPVEDGGSGEPQPQLPAGGDAEPVALEGPRGCSSGGGSLAAAGLLVIASLLLRRRQPVGAPRRARPVR